MLLLVVARHARSRLLVVGFSGSGLVRADYDRGQGVINQIKVVVLFG